MQEVRYIIILLFISFLVLYTTIFSLTITPQYQGPNNPNSFYKTEETTAIPKVSDDEQLKLSQEYQDYQKKLDLKKEEYRKEHPDEMKEKDMEDWYETDNQRELRQIFQGQSSMFEVLRDLNRKIDEVVGRQERTMSLISTIQHGVGLPQGAAQPQQMHQPGLGRPEIDAIIQNQNIILTTAGEIKAYVTDIKIKTDNILTNQARQPTAQVQSVGYDMQSLVSEMRDGLNHLKLNIGQAQPRGAPIPECPKVSCVSLTTLLIVCAIQLVVMLGYSLYRDNKEAQAKKFY